ncbi:MAG TPA: heat-shock protein Hsp20 [Cytophagales bacterium]|nr:heat-shock protein Hsp20 [Cytophagales bacterium]HAA23322.1 heat-shock protein Hsp20 [Cytophagales bacterium]HAP64994.1 heat-shock protein Hsp20 [Cytophagales bacterium]
MLDDFFDRSFTDFGAAASASKAPAVNVKETDSAFGLEVALPGVGKDQVNLELDHNVLTISSEAKTDKEEAKGGYTRREFGYNAFRRSFTLPEIADQEKIDAKFENGVLNVSIPKLDEKALKNARAISIN